MYTKLGGLGVAALPFTGLNLAWELLAAFTLIGAGLALWRIAPRRKAR